MWSQEFPVVQGYTEFILRKNRVIPGLRTGLRTRTSNPVKLEFCWFFGGAQGEGDVEEPGEKLSGQGGNYKSVETLGNKIDFRASWTQFSPFPPNNVDFSISLTSRTTAPTQN